MANGIRVLLIDDDPGFLETLSSWVQFKGYSVLTALDGASGIRQVREGLADMVFVDFQMPGMDGMQVIKHIRGFNKTIPIVLVTGYPGEILISQVQEFNLAGFFPKASPFAKLEAVLEVVLRNFQRLRDPLK